MSYTGSLFISPIASQNLFHTVMMSTSLEVVLVSFFIFGKENINLYIQSLKEHNPSLLNHSYILSDKDEWLDRCLIGTLKRG